MTTKLFVGNLDFSTMEHQLREAFEPHGNVVSATLITDRMTGRSRGFGFVEFETQEEAQRAIDALDGQDMGGRQINVSIARERKGNGGGRGGFRNKDRGGRGGGRGGGGRGGGDRW